MTNLALGGAVLLALVVVALAIWLVPRRQVQGWRRAGITEEDKLAELGVQARTNITQALGGLALIATLAITAYQVNQTRRSSDDTLRLAEQGQVSERFSRAVEQLGATDTHGEPALDVRIGGLFSLLRIGLDSKANVEPAFLVVATYVGRNYVPPKTLPRHGCDHFQLPRLDVARALTFVLPRVAKKLREETGKPTPAGLRGTILDGLGLDGLVLTGLNLTGIKVRFAQLEGANFRESNLRAATFHRACLRHANFHGADLRAADLSGARLDRADFRGATLSPTTNFTSAQVKGAKFSKGVLDVISLSRAQKREVIVSS